ncbi:MAG: SDR family oxidoreductase [Saprospiraceae bacterium]
MKNILLTGISKGLGLEITKTLLQSDYNIYGISRSISIELADLIAKYPNRIKHLKYDLSNVKDVKKTIFKKWLDGVVIYGYINNAAMAYDTLLTNMKLDKVTQMTMINQITPMLITKYVIRNMILNNTQGTIVHISSISVHTGYKGLAMYAATKGALEAFSKTTAREWGTKNIRSNCIVAGFMETDMTNVIDKSVKDRIYNRTSLKKPTNINSVAETTVFLMSQKAKSITGQNIHVDNGTI